MIDYEINNDVECPYCFHSPLHNRACTNFCDEGFIDESDNDPINFMPGESLIPCQECKGTGTEWWCPQCGANLSDKIKECGFADDEDFTNTTEQPTSKGGGSTKPPVSRSATIYAVTGTFHGSLVEAHSEGEARRIFHRYYKGESITHVVKRGYAALLA